MCNLSGLLWKLPLAATAGIARATLWPLPATCISHSVSEPVMSDVSFSSSPCLHHEKHPCAFCIVPTFVLVTGTVRRSQRSSRKGHFLPAAALCSERLGRQTWSLGLVLPLPDCVTLGQSPSLYFLEKQCWLRRHLHTGAGLR